MPVVFFMILNDLIKYVILFIIFLNSLKLKNEIKNDVISNFCKFGQYSLTSLAKNKAKFPEIYLTITDLNYTYSKKNNLIEIIYYITFFDIDYHLIKPSNLALLYNLGIFCNFYSFETHENIYSIANIHENRDFYCIEYSKIGEQAKFGIKIYKIKEIGEENEYSELFFFTHKLININNDPSMENNYKFDIYHVRNNYIQSLNKIKEFLYTKDTSKNSNNLLYSYLQPPLFFLKKDIAQFEGKWYFKNIYEKYFCFCKGENCIDILAFYKYEFQSCKYFFYLTIIDENKFLYPKTHYLFSDFFDYNIEPSDAFPIFQEIIKTKLKAHYVTMSWNIYKEFCLKNSKCISDLLVIYGIRRIDGDVLEKYLELFLKLKAVVAAERYDGIDNFFYNVDYIVYIFLGHGVQFIKSFLYKDYLSPKKYNKMLLPPSDIFISVALSAGWKNEDIIKINCPKFDKYEIYGKKKLSFEYSENNERSIFVMFTWRKVKKGKSISVLYYDNISKLLNNTEINEQLLLNNVKMYFCYHHALKENKKLNIDNDTNIRFISQNEISILLKNSSLIITDFSAILFDAIVQRKPLILYLPDGLDPNLQNIYTNEYYETINKIKNGIIYLKEVFLDFDKFVNKIIYYINNDFALEKEKLKIYKKFRLINRGNIRKFIKYLKKLK